MKTVLITFESGRRTFVGGRVQTGQTIADIQEVLAATLGSREVTELLRAHGGVLQAEDEETGSTYRLALTGDEEENEDGLGQFLNWVADRIMPRAVPTRRSKMRREATCAFCHREVVDGREESGFTGVGPDWMTPDGDFGCYAAPETSEDGVGSHRTWEELRAIYRIVSLDDKNAPVWERMRAELYGSEED